MEYQYIVIVMEMYIELMFPIQFFIFVSQSKIWE
jgi:hypothetical protein